MHARINKQSQTDLESMPNDIDLPHFSLLGIIFMNPPPHQQTATKGSTAAESMKIGFFLLLSQISMDVRMRNH